MTAKPREPGAKIVLYNPGQLAKSAVIDQFVVRLPLLERLLDDLRNCRPEESNQHHLIVGPRGMGKTMLLRRLRFAIEDDSELSRVWLPLVFPEEQYNVARLSDFWNNCLVALSDALDQRGRSVDARALDAVVGNLPRDDEDRRSRLALDALQRFAEREDVGLVLLVDNIDMVLDAFTDDQQWAFRNALSTGQRLLLIGASPRGVESAYQYNKAFYDFFQVHTLRGLSELDARTMLQKLAERQGDPAVSKILAHDPARFQTMHVLTGGNPRALAVVYEVFAQGADSDVATDLERVLDQQTPLYKGRVEELSPQARQVVDGLALHWDPMTAAELAERLGLDVKHVSALLSRLVQQQVVATAAFPPGRKNAYLVADRFFNLWYLMRASLRSRQRLVGLARFLRVLARLESASENPGGGKTRGGRAAVDLLAGGLGSPSAYLAPGRWDEAASAARERLGRAEGLWDDASETEILAFFLEAAKRGRSAEVLELLDEAGDSDRWSPLHRTLCAIVANDPDLLLRLAPEIREPAERLFQQITAGPAAETSQKPKRRRS